MKTGITLETFREEGNFPVENERFTSSAIAIEILGDTSLRIFVGILLGPVLLEIGIALIKFEISSGVAGVRNIEFRLGSCRYSEKSETLSGILDLIVSATFEKKKLKQLATRKGSEVTVPPISRDIGLADEEIISLIPYHKLTI